MHNYKTLLEADLTGQGSGDWTLGTSRDNAQRDLFASASAVTPEPRKPREVIGTRGVYTGVKFGEEPGRSGSKLDLIACPVSWSKSESRLVRLYSIVLD